jgi:hypothetical protein
MDIIFHKFLIYEELNNVVMSIYVVLEEFIS